jgi:hypothetical protein
MCRNIRELFHFEPPATDDEIVAAARQYVRKVSGAPCASRANREAVLRATLEIAAITRRLVLGELVTSAPKRDRAALREKARARGAARDARVVAKLGGRG